MGSEILRGEDEEDQDRCHVLQSHLVRKLVKTFGELVKNKRRTNMPGTPRKVQTVPKKDEEKLGADKHKEFRSGVGCLLCLLKHS